MYINRSALIIRLLYKLIISNMKHSQASITAKYLKSYLKSPKGQQTFSIKGQTVNMLGIKS